MLDFIATVVLGVSYSLNRISSRFVFQIHRIEFQWETTVHDDFFIATLAGPLREAKDQGVSVNRKSTPQITFDIITTCATVSKRRIGILARHFWNAL